MQPSSELLQVVYVAADGPQAQLLAAMLEREGIDVVVSNEALQHVSGGLPAGFDIAPRVLVRPEDAQRARELAMQWETRLRESRRDADAGPRGYQFSVRTLLLVTTGVAIYFGTRQAMKMAGGDDNGAAAQAAVYLYCAVVILLGLYRKIRARRESAD